MTASAGMSELETVADANGDRVDLHFADLAQHVVLDVRFNVDFLDVEVDVAVGADLDIESGLKCATPAVVIQLGDGTRGPVQRAKVVIRDDRVVDAGTDIGAELSGRIEVVLQCQGRRQTVLTDRFQRSQRTGGYFDIMLLWVGSGSAPPPSSGEEVAEVDFRADGLVTDVDGIGRYAQHPIASEVFSGRNWTARTRIIQGPSTSAATALMAPSPRVAARASFNCGFMRLLLVRLM